MLIAVLESSHGSIKRDVDFSRGTFTAEGLGEVCIDDLRELDVNRQLEWVSPEVRALALGYSPESAVTLNNSHLAETQLQLAVETEIVYVPAHRVGSKSEAELRRIVGDMIDRGWILVEDSRVGASGGHLTFQRAEPLDPAILAAVSLAG